MSNQSAEAPPATEVVTLGEAMILLLAAEGTPLSAATTFTRSVAGAESNVAIGLSRLGHRVAFYGCVGADIHGQVVIRTLRGERIDIRRVREVRDATTGLILRDSPSGRPINVAYHRHNSAGTYLNVDDIDREQLAGARLLHITGITAALSDSARAAIETAADIARDAGLTVVLDPNIRLRLAPIERWRQIIDNLTRRADVVLAGADELDLLCADRANSGWFLSRGAGRVVIKDGIAGAVETDGTNNFQVPAYPVQVADPVGAGDAFAAGWISGWLRGQDPATRMAEAAAVASCAVAVRTDIDGLPDAATRACVVNRSADVDR